MDKLLFPPLGKQWDSPQTLKTKFLDGEDFFTTDFKIFTIRDFKDGETVKLMSGGPARCYIEFSVQRQSS